jgi:hypothetical protein
MKTSQGYKEAVLNHEVVYGYLMGHKQDPPSLRWKGSPMELVDGLLLLRHALVGKADEDRSNTVRPQSRLSSLARSLP